MPERRPALGSRLRSSCVDQELPSIYDKPRQGTASDGSQDVSMSRGRVGQIANTYAAGPAAGNFGATDPWNSALWTHLDGASGAPATPIDRIDRSVGIWSKLPPRSRDYVGDSTNVTLHAPDPGGEPA